MKKAILYCRVSTEEQGRHGFSLGYQEDRMREYCKAHNYIVDKVFTDEFSGKTFKRPEYIKAIKYCERFKDVEVFVVLKWDRFGRNLFESFAEINKLRAMGIKVDCVEQNFDENNPEDLLLQAIYFAVPEVENRRRGKNTKQGIRKALKLGRWPQGAPVGYKNVTQNGQKVITPSNKAPLVREAFEKFASGKYERMELLKIMNKKGLRLSRKRWADFLRNPLYMGKVLVPVDEETGEDEYLVDGLHEAIVDEVTYNQVQAVLKNTGRKNPRKKQHFKDEMPLRGLLICGCCGRRLTGSRSKSGSGRFYYYYHCREGCKLRVNSIKTHIYVLELLKSLRVDESVLKLYDRIVEKTFENNEGSRAKKVAKLESELSSLQNKLSDLDEKYINNKLNNDNYSRITERLNSEVEEMKKELEEVRSMDTNYLKYLKAGKGLVADLPYYFKHASPRLQYAIISSIFPKNLILDDTRCRTQGVNEVIQLIWQVKGYKSKKTSGENPHSSRSVAGAAPVFY